MSTIAEVAKEAGVSVATVSRVINQTSPVSPETENKVNAAISKLNYCPNVLARSFRTNESRMISVLIPNITNPYYSKIVAGIEDTMKRNGYNTMLCITEMDRVRTKEFLDLMRYKRADGAIVLETTACDLISTYAKNHPIVQCSEFCIDASISYVSIDNFAAAKQIVEYLMSLGHKKIGFIGSTNEFYSSKQRKNGYIDALNDAGIKIDSKYMNYADDNYSFRSGVQAAKEMLSQSERPTAIFCISDMIALGALGAANELGINVPKDVSIIGFDDVEYATMFHPLLTTVSQPCYSLGKVAADLMLKRLNGKRNIQRIILDHKLILRESSTAVVSD